MALTLHPGDQVRSAGFRSATTPKLRRSRRQVRSVVVAEPAVVELTWANRRPGTDGFARWTAQLGARIDEQGLDAVADEVDELVSTARRHGVAIVATAVLADPAQPEPHATGPSPTSCRPSSPRRLRSARDAVGFDASGGELTSSSGAGAQRLTTTRGATMTVGDPTMGPAGAAGVDGRHRRGTPSCASWRRVERSSSSRAARRASPASTRSGASRSASASTGWPTTGRSPRSGR